MQTQWCVTTGPWQTAQQMLQESDPSEIAAICIQESLPARADASLSRWLDSWRNQLDAVLGPQTNQCVQMTRFAASAILQYECGCIVRLFADISVFQKKPQINFEIIGKKRSIFYRSSDVAAEFTTSVGRMGVHAVPLAEDLQTIECVGDPVRLGVIGLDHPHATGNHFPSLDYIKHITHIAAIADEDHDRCTPYLQKYGARYYSKRDDLLADENIDAVLITTQNCYHAADAIAAARAGKDIFCDKPIATTLDDTLAIVDAVRASGVRFITTFPVRFHPAVQELRRRIDAGEFGEIQAIMATNHGCMYAPGTPQWVLDPRRNGGGCIIDHTVHVADTMRYLTGCEFDSVQAVASTSLHEVAAEDIAVLHGRMSGDILFQIDCSWSRKASDPPWGDVTLRLVGTLGSASLDLYNNAKVEIFSPNGIEYRYPNTLCHQHGMIFCDHQRHRESGIEAINANEIDGLRTMELVFSAYESLARHAVVKNVRHATSAAYSKTPDSISPEQATRC